MASDLHLRPPRAVADLPALDPAAVGKGWVVELVARGELDELGHLDLGSLARAAPRVAEVLLDAVRADDALPGLAGAGAQAAAAAGATSPGDRVAAVEALRRVVSATLASWVRDGDGARAWELSERLGHVTAVLVAGAAGAVTPAHVPEHGTRLRAVPLTSAERREAATTRALSSRHGAVALVLLEIDHVERLLAADADGAVARALEGLADLVAGELEPTDPLGEDGPGRLWAVRAPATPEQARDLGQRLVEAVADLAAPYGVPLGASVGVAVAPQDGRDAAALEAAAERRLFGALASGAAPF